MSQQMFVGTGGVLQNYGSGSSSDPYTSAYASKLAGHGDGNTYVKINGTTSHVYVNNSQDGGAWILVTKAKSNSTCHHGTGGSGGDGGPINQGGGCHSYSDSYINMISNDTSMPHPYAGTNPNCRWRAYVYNKGIWIYGFNRGNFCSNCAANGSGWDLINNSYANSHNHDLGGNDGSRGFGDHHANGSFFAYNRHNSNNGFSHDNMSDSDGHFWIRH